MTRRVDVAVVGGGPAGAALAIRLTAMGRRVLLIERARGRGRALPQSLSPGVMVQLDLLRAKDVPAACGAWESPLSWVRWSSETPERRDHVGDAALLVDRGAFDAALRTVAVQSGVQLVQPAFLRRADPQAGGGWRLRLVRPDGEVTVSARFLADASGRAGFLREKRVNLGPPTLALHADWTGAQGLDEPRVDSGVEHWAWGMPRGDGRFTAVMFTDPALLLDRSNLEPLYQRLRAASPLFSALDGASLASPTRASDARAYRAERVVGPDWIKVGDAALALDPLSSSGVQKGIRTALTGAVVVNTLLGRPDSGEIARQFFQDETDATARDHQRWAEGLYRDTPGFRAGHDFWVRRSGVAPPPPEAIPEPAIGPDEVTLDPQDRWILSPDARLVNTACLAGDFVEHRTALTHPALPRPIVWMAGTEMATLLRRIQPNASLSDLLDGWKDLLPQPHALAMTRWMVGSRVLVRTGDAG